MLHRFLSPARQKTGAQKLTEITEYPRSSPHARRHHAHEKFDTHENFDSPAMIRKDAANSYRVQGCAPRQKPFALSVVGATNVAHELAHAIAVIIWGAACDANNHANACQRNDSRKGVNGKEKQRAFDVIIKKQRQQNKYRNVCS